MMVGCVPLYNVLAVIVLTMPEKDGKRLTDAGDAGTQAGQQQYQQPKQGQTPSGYASDSAEIPNNDFDTMPLDDDLPF